MFIKDFEDDTGYTYYGNASESLINPKHGKQPLLTINYEYNDYKPKFKISDDNDKVSFILILLADQYKSLNQCINMLLKGGGKNNKHRTEKKRKNKKKV
jgi:hypothetical protein